MINEEKLKALLTRLVSIASDRINKELLKETFEDKSEGQKGSICDMSGLKK